MAHRFVFRILGVLTLLLVTLPAIAQCAMCNQTATSATQSNLESAEALNNGIIYLMAIPYIVLLTIGILWWRMNQAKKKAES